MTFRSAPFILVLFASILLSYQAQSSDLFFAPKRVSVSDSKPISEIRVTNQSRIAKSYKILIEDIVMTEEGITARVDGFDYSASRMVRFVPRQFDLQPGGRQIVRVMARIPADTPDGEYHSHLSFLENISRREALNKDTSADDGSTASARAEISYTTAIPLTLSKGKIKTAIDLSDLSMGVDEKGEPVISMFIERNGNGQGNAMLDIQYSDPNGATTRIGGRRNVFVYRELDRRLYKTPVNLPEGITVQKGGVIKVVLFNKDISIEQPVKELTLSID